MLAWPVRPPTFQSLGSHNPGVSLARDVPIIGRSLPYFISIYATHLASRSMRASQLAVRDHAHDADKARVPDVQGWEKM